MRVLFVILGILVFSVSCSDENIDDSVDCDGSLQISLESTTPLTSCSANDGAIVVRANGGKQPYSFRVNGGSGQSASTFTGLSMGNHRVEVVDANGCMVEIPIIPLTAPNSTLNLTVVQINPDTDCFSDNGSIVISGAGGNGSSYEFALDGSSFGGSGEFIGLSPRQYTIKVKDADGCIVLDQASVPQGDTGVSFSGTIRPIINANCANNSSCHSADAGGGRPRFNGFESIKSTRERIKAVITYGSMPPRDSEFTLTAQQKILIVCWIDSGAPNN